MDNGKMLLDGAQGWMMAHPATTLALAAVPCLAVLAYRAALPQPLPGIPYEEVSGRRVLGSIPSMMAHLKKHGAILPWMTGQNAIHQAPLVQFFPPFAKPVLILCDFQESQDILLRRPRDFDRSDMSIVSFESVIPHFQLAMKSHDDRLKGNKELVRDLMTPKFLNEVSAPEMYLKCLALIDLWTIKTRAAGGKPFEARLDIFDAAMDIVIAAAFAIDDSKSLTRQHIAYLSSAPSASKPQQKPDGSVEFTRPAQDPDMAALQAVTAYLAEQVNSPFPRLTHWLRTTFDSSIKRSMAHKERVIRSKVQESLDRVRTGGDTLRSATDYIIQREYKVATKEGREPDVFSRRILDEMYGYVVAGHETTSSSLSWTLKLLADHEPVQTKLRETLRAAFSLAVSESRLPTAAEIAKAQLPYLDAVIEECLRVGSPTPMVARQSQVDTTVLGHAVPKGVTVLFNSVGPGFHQPPLAKGVVPDAVRSDSSRTSQWGRNAWNPDDLHLFKPERWLRTTAAGQDGQPEQVAYDSQAGPFLSFSLGARGCFGRRLAYLEIRILLTLLLWNFVFNKIEEGGDIASYATVDGITVMPKFCYVQLEKLE